MRTDSTDGPLLPIAHTSTLVDPVTHWSDSTVESEW